MAVQTKRSCRISAAGSVVLEVWMEYDDADYRVEANDDGEHDDFRVIRWFGTNHSDFPKTVTLFNPNGTVWHRGVIPAGESFSQNAGGRVKYEFDVPCWEFD
jgi:hypothetical protein